MSRPTWRPCPACVAPSGPVLELCTGAALIALPVDVDGHHTPHDVRR